MSIPRETIGNDALFLDFDGTLVDIAERPEAVRVDPALPGLLSQLQDRLGGALAIVTGRPVAGVDAFLPGLGLDACGLHGLETRLDGHLHTPDGLPSLRAEVDALRGRLARFAGVVIEDKGVGVAVHWRMAPDAEHEARAAIDDLAARLGPTHKVQDGKAVREIVPAQAGKGAGIRALMGRPPYRGRRPIFIGDDLTDEHGFAAVAELGGVTVKIGPGATEARHRLHSPAELRHRFVAWLTEGSDPVEWPPA